MQRKLGVLRLSERAEVEDMLEIVFADAFSASNALNEGKSGLELSQWIFYRLWPIRKGLPGDSEVLGGT